MTSLTADVDDALAQLTCHVDGHLALLAVTGSRAYGTDHPDSDTDLRGVYLATATTLLSGAATPDQYQLTRPDTVVFELAKFLKLAAAGNPNMLEVLFSPQLAQVSAAGEVLLEARDQLLSTAAYNAYRGFAVQQAKALRNGSRGSATTPHKRRKFLLHAFRLTRTGQQLLTTGKLHVAVDDPDRLQQLAQLDDDDALAEFDRQLALLDAAAETTMLPERCDPHTLAELTLQVRRAADAELDRYLAT